MNIVHLQLSGGIGGISVLTRDLAGISDHNNIFYFLFEGGVIADDMAKNGSLVHVEDGKHFAFLSEAKKFTAFCKKIMLMLSLPTQLADLPFSCRLCEKTYKKYETARLFSFKRLSRRL